MQITGTQFKASRIQKRPARTPEQPTVPSDTFTFSGSKNNQALVMLGFGVSVTGLIAGAQMDNPAVMMGSFLGGVALMVAGSG